MTWLLSRPFSARDLSRLFSVIVGLVSLCVIHCFQADRDVLAKAMQEQLDSYLAIKACKYCGRVFPHFTKPSRMYLLERAGSREMQTEKLCFISLSEFITH